MRNMIELRISRRFGMSHIALFWYGKCAAKVSVRSMPFKATSTKTVAARRTYAEMVFERLEVSK